MQIKITQKLKISFWAISEELADEAFDYIYDKWFKHDDDDLEFDNSRASDEGTYVDWVCTAVRYCTRIPATREEPEDTDYSSLINVDEPKDWIKIFMSEKGLDENSIDEIYVDEDLEEDYDDR